MFFFPQINLLYKNVHGSIIVQNSCVKTAYDGKKNIDKKKKQLFKSADEKRLDNFLILDRSKTRIKNASFPVLYDEREREKKKVLLLAQPQPPQHGNSPLCRVAKLPRYISPSPPHLSLLGGRGRYVVYALGADMAALSSLFPLKKREDARQCVRLAPARARTEIKSPRWRRLIYWEHIRESADPAAIYR